MSMTNSRPKHGPRLVLVLCHSVLPHALRTLEGTDIPTTIRAKRPINITETLCICRSYICKNPWSRLRIRLSFSVNQACRPKVFGETGLWALRF